MTTMRTEVRPLIEIDRRVPARTGVSLPRCLYVASHVPSAMALQAGHKVAHRNLVVLCETYRVHALIATRERELELVSSLKELPISLEIRWVSDLARAAGGATALSGIPPRFATRMACGLARRVRDLLKSGDFACLFCEFPQSAPIIDTLPIELRPPKSIWSMHDSQSMKAERAPVLSRTILAAWYREYERHLADQFDEVAVLSEKDRVYLEKIGVGTKISVRRPYHDDYSKVRVIRETNGIFRRRSVFWGAMDREENLDAVTWFLDRCFPALSARFPGFEFVVVGANPPSKLLRQQHIGVRVTQYVADPSNEFARASFAILPLRRGSGVKIKTYECLSAGLKVIASPVAAEGVEWHEPDRLIIADIKCFADAVARELAVE